MDKLRSSIEEANQAVDKEREKNVSLLHMIFPPDIAKRLWLGKMTSFFCARALRAIWKLIRIFKSFEILMISSYQSERENIPNKTINPDRTKCTSLMEIIERYRRYFKASMFRFIWQ